MKYASAEKPAMVLIDLLIPGRHDGIAVAEQLSARHKDTIIFIANSSEEARRAQAQHPSRYGFISRPLDERELIIALELAQYRHDAEKKTSVSLNELKKYRALLEAVIARRTAELRKTNAQLRRLLHFIELTERKLATESLNSDNHDERVHPIFFLFWVSDNPLSAGSGSIDVCYVLMMLKQS